MRYENDGVKINQESLSVDCFWHANDANTKKKGQMGREQLPVIAKTSNSAQSQPSTLGIRKLICII